MKSSYLKTGGFFALGLLSCWSEPAPSSALSAPGLKFTLKEAETYALLNHPQIASANLTADAVRQQIREARSAFFPQVYAESDSVYAPENTRLGAEYGVSNPSVFSRQSDGFTASQLITDFGRTYEIDRSPPTFAPTPRRPEPTWRGRLITFWPWIVPTSMCCVRGPFCAWPMKRPMRDRSPFSRFPF